MTGPSLLNHAVISQRYFFPRQASPPDPFWVECDGARLACIYNVVDPEFPTIVHFHGNGEVVTDYLDGFTDVLGHMGCNCFLAEFRGYGGSSGQPELGKMLEDVSATIKAIPVPEERLVLFGRSVGSLFAIKAAEFFPNVAGLILESAIADPLERLLLRLRPEEIGATLPGLTAEVTEAINIRDILCRFNAPTLILHARHDGLIDASHAEKLADWCPGAKLTIFPSGTHNDIMFVNDREYFSEIELFLSRLKL